MAHVVREGGKLVPEGYLKLVAHKGDGRSFGFAAPVSDKTGVLVRQTKGGLPMEEVDVFQKHDAIKDHRIVMAFDKDVLHEDDQQPFTLLSNGDDVPQIVAFLDGDFSEYHDDGSSHTDEFFCVQKELIPRIAKLSKFLGGNAAAIMEELKSDPSYGRDWVNFMSGPSGSITLVGADGTIHTFTIAGDTAQHEYDGWWTSNKLDYMESSKSGNALDDLASAMAGKSSRPKVRPSQHVASTEPLKPQVAKPKAETPGGGDGKPVAAPELPVQPAPNVGDAPADGKKEVPAGSGPDYTNPETVLTIDVPKHFDSFKAKLRWVKKRLPEGMIPDDTQKAQEYIKGLHQISLKRAFANKAFLQDFAQQKGLSGLNALGVVTNGGNTSVPSVKPAEAPKATATATALPAHAGRPKMRPTSESGYPAKAGEPHKDAEVQPAISPTPKAPDAPAQAVMPPLPVLSESQVKQVTEYIEKPETKAAIDKAGRVIADPKNLEKIEQSVPSLAKQTANRLTVDDASKLPYEILIQIGIMNPNTLANIAFWLGHELHKTYAMLDELTKRPEAETREVQAPVAGHEQAARELRPSGQRPKFKRSA